MIFNALEKAQPAEEEVAVNAEQRVERLGKFGRHIVIVAIRLHATQAVKRGTPLRFQRFHAGELKLQALCLRAGGKMGVGVRLALNELGQPDFPAVGEMLERAQRGDLQTAAIGLGDEVPKCFSQRGRIRTAFEVDAIKKLDDRLGDEDRLLEVFFGIVRSSSRKRSIMLAAARAASRPRLSWLPMHRA